MCPECPENANRLPEGWDRMKTKQFLLFRMALITALLLGACKLPSRATETPKEEPPTITPRPSATSTPAPSDTPALVITDTLTPEPTSTPTILYTVAVTFSPTPTSGPGVAVRIRNMTGGPINLYRHGRSGEIHFLGWLVHGYYGIFQFPSLGEWTIRYCKRDTQGNSYECLEKNIQVKENDQEFRVP
jgi:hypothetical protein